MFRMYDRVTVMKEGGTQGNRENGSYESYSKLIWSPTRQECSHILLVLLHPRYCSILQDENSFRSQSAEEIEAFSTHLYTNEQSHTRKQLTRLPLCTLRGWCSELRGLYMYFCDCTPSANCKLLHQLHHVGIIHANFHRAFNYIFFVTNCFLRSLASPLPHLNQFFERPTFVSPSFFYTKLILRRSFSTPAPSTNRYLINSFCQVCR